MLCSLNSSKYCLFFHNLREVRRSSFSNDFFFTKKSKNKNLTLALRQREAHPFSFHPQRLSNVVVFVFFEKNLYFRGQMRIMQKKLRSIIEFLLEHKRSKMMLWIIFCKFLIIWMTVYIKYNKDNESLYIWNRIDLDLQNVKTGKARGKLVDLPQSLHRPED